MDKDTKKIIRDYSQTFTDLGKYDRGVKDSETPKGEIEQFMETPAMKRLLGAENLLMATGRLGEYHGKTIQDELKNLLQQQIQEKMKFLGTLFGENLYLQTNNDVVLEEVGKWLEEARRRMLEGDDKKDQLTK